jgi:transcription elongation factor GreA
VAILTLNGKKKLEEEYQRLLRFERPSVIAAIEEARAHGDLRENAEYHAAKEKQGFVEGRIADISSKLANAEIIDPSTIKESKIVFGATIHLLNVNSDEKIKYQIVGEDEVDISKGKISVMTPIAKALIGKRQGDVVTVNIPKGEVEYEILKIEYV